MYACELPSVCECWECTTGVHLFSCLFHVDHVGMVGVTYQWMLDILFRLIADCCGKDVHGTPTSTA